MKIVAFTCLHYGLPYLDAAIRSVIDAVDEHYIIYSDIGSHGHRTDVPCPDKREDLMEVAYNAAGNKLRWFEGHFPYEGAQRDKIFEVAPDADLIIVVDSDEIYSEALIKQALFHLDHDGYSVRRIRVPMIHYWRSFSRCILHDPASPVRFIYPKANEGEMGWPHGFSYLNHFGYAIPPYLMEYKWRIHGHKNELRRDVDWFNDVFMDESRVRDLHPVGSEYWNWETVNPLDYLPEWMKTHKYANCEVIE